jgi:hypothetical protein
MEDFAWCYLKDKSYNTHVRAVIRNLQDWALGERLESPRTLLGDHTKRQ